MDWNDLRYVLAIAREGTLLGAASSVGVAHTTVGRRVRALEDRLGVRLFDRTPDGLIATAAGEDLAAVAEQVEGQVLSAEGRVRGRDEQLRGPLKVSTFDALFYGFADVFASFAARYPGVDLVVTASADEVSLTRREADVVARLSNAPPQTAVGRKVGYVQFGVYAGRGLVEKYGEQAALADYPWIGWEGGQNLRWFEGWLETNAPGAKVVLRMDYQAPMVAHAVRSNIGAQILPCFLADADPLLQRIAALDDLFRLDLWLLTSPELRTNSRVRAFIQHTADALGEGQEVLAGAAAAENA